MFDDNLLSRTYEVLHGFGVTKREAADILKAMDETGPKFLADDRMFLGRQKYAWENAKETIQRDAGITEGGEIGDERVEICLTVGEALLLEKSLRNSPLEWAVHRVLDPRAILEKAIDAAEHQAFVEGTKEQRQYMLEQIRDRLNRFEKLAKLEEAENGR